MLCRSFSKAMARRMDLWLNLQLGFTFPVNIVVTECEMPPPAFPIRAVFTWPDLTLAPGLLHRIAWVLVSFVFVPRARAGCFRSGKCNASVR